MAKRLWTDEENDRIVADYFRMLMKCMAGQEKFKTEHRLALMPHLQNRTKPSIEFKHRNISAVLASLGVRWVKGYWPATNIQTSLVDAVMRWLSKDPENFSWLERLPGPQETFGQNFGVEIPVGPPPTQSNQSPTMLMEKMLGLARKFDTAGRDERNRALGRAGEERVLAHERAILEGCGRGDLARNVRWVSEEDGDGAGYDIASFACDGRRRLIEVKTTNGWERTPFHITRNELAVAEQQPDWLLFRLWNFSSEPKAFELHPPLKTHVSLIAMTFQANIL